MDKFYLLPQHFNDVIPSYSSLYYVWWGQVCSFYFPSLYNGFFLWLLLRFSLYLFFKSPLAIWLWYAQECVYFYFLLFFKFLLLGVCWTSWCMGWLFFYQIWTTCAILFSFFFYSNLSSLLGTLTILTLDQLILFHRSLSLFSFIPTPFISVYQFE